MKKRNLFILMVFVFIILTSLYFDSEIISMISSFRGNILDNFFTIINFLSSKIIIFSILTGLFLLYKNKRRLVFPLWITIGFSVVISFLLKVFVQRARPFQIGIVSLPVFLEKANHLIWNFSFPSFHAMLAFCALPLLSKEFPKIKYIWLGFAFLIAFSRIYFGLHFLSDVLSGALIGYIVGIIVLKKESEDKLGEKIYKKIFKK